MVNYSILFFITHFSFIITLIIFLNNKDNILIMFIVSELLNLTGILNFIIYFNYFQNLGGEALALIMFSLGAAETAMG